MKKSSKQNRLDKIKNELGKFDLLAPGRLRTTFMKCGNPKCACHKDKKSRHGPYHLWDRKVGTKLTSKMVPDEAYKKIENWINERKELEKLMAEAIKISQELIADEIEKERGRK